LATIGLSMIVKNGGEDLRSCLRSVRPLVDQIVIADTGSTNDTVEIAREFGAVVVTCPWTDHYADARNVALAPITTDWVVVLDADEELPVEAIRMIPELLECSDNVGGYTVTFRNYFKDRVTGMLSSLSRENKDTNERAKGALSHAEHKNCRLFRRHPNIYFTGRIHEGVESQILAAGLEYRDSGVDVLHFGYLADESRFAEKQDYYYAITKRAIEEAPNNPHLWLQMGMSEIKVRENVERAVECFEMALKLDQSCHDARVLMGVVHKGKKRYGLAIQAFSALPDEGDLGITKTRALGDLMLSTDQFADAHAMYARAHALLLSNDGEGLVGLKAEIDSKLGYTEVLLGLHEDGLQRLRSAVELSPMLTANHDRLIKACVIVDDGALAADAAEEALKHHVSEAAFVRAAALRLSLQQSKVARTIALSGLQHFPDSDMLQRVQAHSA
jgi:glycosyltransferase involved in cell wall biosynthesis